RELAMVLASSILTLASNSRLLSAIPRIAHVGTTWLGSQLGGGAAPSRKHLNQEPDYAYLFSKDFAPGTRLCPLNLDPGANAGERANYQLDRLQRSSPEHHARQLGQDRPQGQRL